MKNKNEVTWAKRLEDSISFLKKVRNFTTRAATIKDYDVAIESMEKELARERGKEKIWEEKV